MSGTPQGGIPPEEQRLQQLEQAAAGLREQVARLTSENAQLKAALASLQAQQEMPTPAELVGSFVGAMKALRESLAASADPSIGYTVSQFDVSLKAMVALRDQAVRFVLPGPGQAVVPDTLSTIHFVLAAIPRPPAAPPPAETAGGSGAG